jgi:hypothetical protein
MDSLVPLQIMVPIEALWALVALERSVVRGWLLVLGVTHEVWHGSSVPAVEALHHTRVAPNERKLATWILDVRVDWWRARSIL